VSCEETAGSIEMAFGVWGAVGPSNRVLDGVHIPPWYVPPSGERRGSITANKEFNNVIR